MKKIVFFMMILALLATGCKKKKSESLNYDDSNPISMVLQGHHQIKASSDYDITYRAINSDPNIEVITVTSDGNIFAKNVGMAKVKMDNGYEDKVVDVKVDLFREPTFEFGCRSSKIRDIYGRPYESGWLPGDTILYYRYTAADGYSWACGEMQFFFYQGGYYESDVFIRPRVEGRLNEYLNARFNYHSTIGDTLEVYKLKQDTNIICFKYATHNQWDEWCLGYYTVEGTKSLDNVLKSLPRSSKLRY